MILTHVMHWIVFIIAVNKIEVHILQTTLLVSDVTICLQSMSLNKYKAQRGSNPGMMMLAILK